MVPLAVVILRVLAESKAFHTDEADETDKTDRVFVHDVGIA
jgi:hypothetical protein